MKPKFYFGQQVWPTQELADKSGEIEPGFIVGIDQNKDIIIYTVVYTDDFTSDFEESKLSPVKPLPPNPNTILKDII